MRATVPGDGALDGGAGEEMFTGLMDQHMSELVPQQWSSSLGEALLRQFHAAAGIAPAALDATAAERESPVPSAHRP